MDKSFFKEIVEQFCKELNVTPTDEKTLDYLADGLEELYRLGRHDAWHECFDAITNVKIGR